MLTVLALTSCGGQATAPGDAPENLLPREETVERGTRQGTVERIAPTTVAEPGEPPLREGPASRNTSDVLAVGTNGMVGSADPLATQTGLDVLAEGGNA